MCAVIKKRVIRGASSLPKGATQDRGRGGSCEDFNEVHGLLVQLPLPKGVLPSRHVVAVKQLFVKTAQGHDDFLNEVVLITGMKHPNLVNLAGCCRRESQKLLVYEYVDHFDVDQILLGSKKQEISGHQLACAA